MGKERKLKEAVKYFAGMLYAKYPYISLLSPLTKIEIEELKDIEGYLTYDENEHRFVIKVEPKTIENSFEQYNKNTLFSYNKDTNVCMVLFHEYLHLFGQHLKFIASVKDKQLGYVACEYYVDRFMKEMNFYSDVDVKIISAVEDIQPKLKEFKLKDLTVSTIYQLLMQLPDEDKDKLRMQFCCFDEKILILITSLQEQENKRGEGEGKGENRNIQIKELLKELEQKIQEARYYSKLLGVQEEVDVYFQQRRKDWAEELLQTLNYMAEQKKYMLDTPSPLSLFDQKVIIPDEIGYTLKVSVIIDVSSSMDVEEIKRGLEYINTEWEIEKILTHSTKVIQEFSSIEGIKKIKVGGGTDYYDAYEKVKDEEIVIHITDGWADRPSNFEKIADKIIFVITKNDPFDWIKKSGCPIVYALKD